MALPSHDLVGRGKRVANLLEESSLLDAVNCGRSERTSPTVQFRIMTIRSRIGPGCGLALARWGEPVQLILQLG